MEIAVVGINHNNAPIEIRERAAFTEAEKIDVLNEIMDSGIEECIILSTCNRSEIYAAYKKGSGMEGIIRDIYKDKIKDDELNSYIFEKKNEQAVEHIFNVASGLDSIVLGEDQILGQVKDAATLAMEIGSSKKVLNRLFRESVTAAKEIKRELKISEIPLSTSYIGVKLIKEKMGELKGKSVLIIGIGHISQLTLKYLLLEDLKSILITNRTHGKLKEISLESDKIEIVDYSSRYHMLNEVDIVISATSAPHTILTKEHMAKQERELYILDLAVPRDIDPRIGEMENINLFDIDDLEKISSMNQEKRENLKVEAKELIEARIEEFNNWMDKSKVDPVIKGLKEKCREIEDDTLEYIFRRANMESREKKIVQKMMNSALKRMVREPIINLKNIEDEEKRELYTKVLLDLFEL